MFSRWFIPVWVCALSPVLSWSLCLGSRPLAAQQGFESGSPIPPAMRETWVGKIPWRRERLPTPVFWPGEFHRLYSPWSRKVLDTTEQLPLGLKFSQFCCPRRHCFGKDLQRPPYLLQVINPSFSYFWLGSVLWPPTGEPSFPVTVSQT